MLLLSEKDIQKMFTKKDANCTNNEGLSLILKEVDNSEIYESIKVVKIFPEKSHNDSKVVSGQILLVDVRTSLIIAVLDGECVNELYTRCSTQGIKGEKIDLLAKNIYLKASELGVGFKWNDLEKTDMNIPCIQVKGYQ